MMRIRKLSILLMVCFCVTPLSSVQAQARAVKILKLEVNGKEVHKDFKVLLYVNGREIEPVREGEGFLVPAELQSCDSVGVRFIWGNHDLIFDSVNVSKFNTDWIVGVNTKLLDERNTVLGVPASLSKELVMIYYISFVPRDGGDETQVTVKVYK